eukprot:TRINITY_DN9059_c0_g1_i1.p1 TRINITY_DN9059_c0_g1~~TRINITY_DN9059_c0_g1_i1.p1  ORF type:complete len:758 (-),score=156.35 TRINITY_DN9059_c0_g1_i1:150-2423(-)
MSSSSLQLPPLPGSIPLPMGDAHFEIRMIIENAFARQREWLDQRFFHLQDEALARLKSPVFDAHQRPSSVPALQPQRPASSSAGTEASQAWQPGDESARSTCFTDPSNPSKSMPSKSLSRATTTEFEKTRSSQDMPKLHNPLVVEDMNEDEMPALRPVVIVETEDDDHFEQMQELRSKLMMMFDQLDMDKSGTISRYELRRAFRQVGLPSMQESFAKFVRMESSTNDELDRLEWLHMIEEASAGEDAAAFVQFAEKLIEIQFHRGRLLQRGLRPKAWQCFIRHDSAVRMVWDSFMMFLLFFVALSLPFTMGFGQTDALAEVDRVCDFFFLFDVVLNFRTTYIDRDEAIVTNGKKMALNYLKTWFLLDFVSSVPWDSVTAGLMPSLQPARLLKVGKIAKVFKLLRMGKVIKAMAGSEFLEMMEDQFSPKASQTLGRVVNLVVVTTVVCHWLACFMAMVDNGAIDTYLGGVGQATSARYLATLYWAVTTLTTVGYGDFLPRSDQERAYAMLAMVIGSSFYGYIIGCITSLITDADIDKRVFNERMEVVQAWLDFHEAMPAILRRRIRRHFKQHFRDKTVADDATIVCDLSGMLRNDTAYFIIHEKVRDNAAFSGLPNSALASLVCTLKKTTSNADDVLVTAGDPGTAMCIIVEGHAWYSQGHQWVPPELAPKMSSLHLESDLREGSSFGEEIIFSMEQTYQYTIVAHTQLVYYELLTDSFKDRFKNMPDLIAQMQGKFVKNRKQSLMRMDRQGAKFLGA